MASTSTCMRRRWGGHAIISRKVVASYVPARRTSTIDPACRSTAGIVAGVSCAAVTNSADRLRKIALFVEPTVSQKRATDHAASLKRYGNDFRLWLTFGAELYWPEVSGRRRARSSSTPARPYICRFSILSRLICPSTGPLLQRWLTAASTAARSCWSVRTKRMSA